MWLILDGLDSMICAFYFFGQCFPDVVLDAVEGGIGTVDGGLVLLPDLLVNGVSVVFEGQPLVVVNGDLDLDL